MNTITFAILVNYPYFCMALKMTLYIVKHILSFAKMYGVNSIENLAYCQVYKFYKYLLQIKVG